MAVVLFEDQYVSRLAPITTTRPAYAINCGGNRLLDLAAIVGQPVHGVVRPHLQALQAARFSDIANDLPADGQTHLFVNARLVPTPNAMTQLQRGSAAANDWAILEEGQLLAAKLTSHQPLDGLIGSESLESWVGSQTSRIANSGNVLTLFQYPHDVVNHHQKIAASGIELYAQRRGINQVADGVFIADQQSFAPNVSTNVKAGPIVVAEGARIGPGSVLIGPILIGQHAIVREHAAIKDGTVIGSHCRVGGEVESSILEAYTNKQHYGYLGHSYIGSWVNLGAGTCNSDLKNTYGDVKMTYGDQSVDTGERLMGCILGDFVKAAINTSIFTGKTVGACSNLYGFIAENVAPFVNYAKSLGSISTITPEIVTKMQERMFARRDVKQLDCDRELIQQLFEATATMREGLEDRPPVF